MQDTSAPLVEHRFPCDTCGSDLRFDPGAHQLTCDHCGNTQGIDAVHSADGGIRELDFRKAVQNQLPGEEIEETRVVTWIGESPP